MAGIFQMEFACIGNENKKNLFQVKIQTNSFNLCTNIETKSEKLFNANNSPDERESIKLKKSKGNAE